MKTILSALFLAILVPSSVHAATLRGTVVDATGAALPGVTIAVEGLRTVTTSALGTFAAEVPPGTHDLRVSLAGFETVVRRASAGETLEIVLAPSFTETMVVSGIRAEEAVPVTKSELRRDEIRRSYTGQDVPLLLRETPSIHSYAESGVGGAGYSYISLRGVAPSRINFTLDGVPLADSEDMGTYFADFPDLARSLESVQIQRGVGTSTVGIPSFGGSVNMESIGIESRQRVEATLGAGSFGNRQVSAAIHSGDLGGGFAFYARASVLESDGFRDHSGVRQRNLFVSASKPLGEALLKLTGFSGHEDQQLSYYAADADTLKSEIRTNPMHPDEKDSFGYDLAHLQYIRPLDAASDMTASVYYQRGYGWYRLRDYGTEVLREFGLDGMLVGSMLTYSRTAGALKLNGGVHVNRFERAHTRDLLGGQVSRDYANDGIKREANAFARAGLDSGRWHFFADAQVRYADFEYRGDVEVEPVSWTFFNPKVGARYATTPASSLYLSLGMTTREPTRSDLFHGEDNPSIPYDPEAVRPERVLDLEAGWNWRAGDVEADAAIYAMEFRNEIAATGELTEMGLPLRRNVDQSYRRGIELDVAWQASPLVRVKSNLTLSRNRIRRWTQFFDVYDGEGNWVDARAVGYSDVEPLLTPSILLNQGIELTPNARFSAGAVARYASRSYLDNTGDEDFSAPSYLVADLNASFAVTSWARVSLQVNNLFDRERVYASGYSYRYFLEGARSGTAYYFPQATRNAVVLLDFKL